MKNYRIESAILASGLLVLGLCVYLGLTALAGRDREVSVRGLAEREVKADHVIWPIVYKTTGNDLQAIYADISRARTRIAAFLTQGGIKAGEISPRAPQIVDLRAERYASQPDGRDRYTVTATTIVSTRQVDTVLGLMPRMGELLKEGVAIAAQEYGSNVQYEFTSLNKIKPQMIEEATKNARQAAEKFAKDSDSRLGKIRKATQGLFSIDDRDPYTPHIKRVRVVTSVDYELNS